MLIIFVLLSLFLGFVLGLLISAQAHRTSYIGTLRIDHSDTEPYIFMELDNENVESIAQKRNVILKVKAENYIPQK